MNYKKNNDKNEEYYCKNILPKFSKVQKIAVPPDIWQDINTNIQKENTLVLNWNIFAISHHALATAAVFIFLSVSFFGYREASMYKQVNQSLNSMVTYLSSDNSIINKDITI